MAYTRRRTTTRSKPRRRSTRRTTGYRKKKTYKRKRTTVRRRSNFKGRGKTEKPTYTKGFGRTILFPVERQRKWIKKLIQEDDNVDEQIAQTQDILDGVALAAYAVGGSSLAAPLLLGKKAVPLAYETWNMPWAKDYRNQPNYQFERIANEYPGSNGINNMGQNRPTRPPQKDISHNERSTNFLLQSLDNVFAAANSAYDAVIGTTPNNQGGDYSFGGAKHLKQHDLIRTILKGSKAAHDTMAARTVARNSNVPIPTPTPNPTDPPPPKVDPNTGEKEIPPFGGLPPTFDDPYTDPYLPTDPYIPTAAPHPDYTDTTRPYGGRDPYGRDVPLAPPPKPTRQPPPNDIGTTDIYPDAPAITDPGFWTWWVDGYGNYGPWVDPNPHPLNGHN